jgi:hypothetical protein
MPWLLALLMTGMAQADLDPLWLRYQQVGDKALQSYSSIQQVAVEGDAATCASSIEQLRAAADELQAGLGKMLGRHIRTTCCSAHESTGSNSTLVVSVRSNHWSPLGKEGFTITASEAVAPAINANTASAALYGSFRFLSYVQQSKPIPANLTSVPATSFRVFDLWDEVDGSVTRGFSGQSTIWPMALYDDARPPPRNQLYMAPCNNSDPWQQWEGTTLHAPDTPSSVSNKASMQCLTTLTADPMTVGPCTGKYAATFLFNHTNLSLAVVHPSAGAGGHRKAGSCLDVNGGAGPDIDLWGCHGLDNLDYKHQQFVFEDPLIRVYDGPASGVKPGQAVPTPRCLTLERTSPPPEGTESPWGGAYKTRFAQLLRLLKSSGINSLAIQDVNRWG